ncbi:hypothetical protein FVP74_08320 [Microbacterium saccharophilum]|uniref:GIY-YIG domain-containing protein n=1 Tax=Microbacterium saccharophilum TaxID=1213358 RepID=A0A5C8HYI8_9MICO|nr:hypothetical protein [Microbacterium saccharophilum]TXK11336.1 hypothetical protein FVP74_08320 [Microbacterium saccharophilum]GEP48791.1 hypothetical protein MSA03_22990 [Microbacterium saccharophilum]
MTIGYLYVTRSEIDGVLYVGQSSKTDADSVANYLGSGDYFKQAIAEHGVENFTKTVLGHFDDQAALDFAEIHAIARLRADGHQLLNAGVGGPRTQREFIRAMFQRFGVLPQMPSAWLQAIDENPQEVRDLVAAGADVSTEDFYREYEAQLRQTQDLSRDCPRCGAAVDDVCRTRTGNPSKNHVGRLAPA